MSSGSLLVADASTTPASGSQASLARHAVCTDTIRWFGGHKVVGVNVRDKEGGVVSRTWIEEVQLAMFPEASVAVKVTLVVPSG